MTQPVCGPKPSGETNTATGRGVTADQIEVGHHLGPGLQRRARAQPGARSTPAPCSPSGATRWAGINGRLIKDDLLDAAIFNYNAKITTACGQDFALVGGGGVFDNTGQKTRLNCLLPDYPAYLVTPEARGADLTAQVTPGPNNSLNFGLARYLAKTYPDSVDHVGYLTGNVATTITNKNQYEEAGLKLGFGKAVYDAQYNSTGEPTWTPIAQAIKDAGVKGLLLRRRAVRPRASSSRLSPRSTTSSTGWPPRPTQYDPKTLAGAGAALDTEPVYVGLGTTPFQSPTWPPSTSTRPCSTSTCPPAPASRPRWA